MPVSKNRRKSKKAQRRKVNRARAESSPGWGGVPDSFDYPALPSPSDPISGLRPMGIGSGGTLRYGVINPPDDPALSEMEQIDAIIGRSVAFEMTEAHHDNIGLREIDLGGEMSGGDISGPMVATITVDPLSTIEGHPRWKTGQDLIDFLDSDPDVFRGEFDGNRWQGLGVQWLECPPEVPNCPYRLEDGSTGGPPGCFQCQRGMSSEEVHFHIVEVDSVATLCRQCWSKGPLPEEDRTLNFEFQFHEE